MVWFRFFILPTGKYRIKGLSFALRLQRKVKSGIHSRNIKSRKNGGLCRERLLTGERSVLGCTAKGNKKAPTGRW